MYSLYPQVDFPNVAITYALHTYCPSLNTTITFLFGLPKYNIIRIQTLPYLPSSDSITTLFKERQLARHLCSYHITNLS